MQHAWWRHQMKTFSALLTLFPGNSLVTDEFPPQRPVTRSFDIFFDQRLNKRLSKHSTRRWFETPSCSLWHHCNESINSADAIRWWRVLLTAWILSRIMVNHMYLNSSAPNAAYMRQWIGSALVQITACRLLGAKPLSKPMLGYCQLDP